MTPRLPRFAEWLLSLSIADAVAREGVIGDLREEYTTYTRLHSRAAGAARYSVIMIFMTMRYMVDRLHFMRPPGSSIGSRRRASGESVSLFGRVVRETPRDVRYGLRTFTKRPGFTAVAVLTLAIGVGANTAIFSAVYSVLLKPLPYTDPDRLVAVWGTSLEVGQERDVISGRNFLDFKRQNATFARMAAYKGGGGALLVDGVPVPTSGLLVSPDFFSVLGARPALGRLFRPEDGRGPTDVSVISHRLWQQQFGGDGNLIGQRIQGVGRSYTVVGVLADDFQFAMPSDLVVPANLDYLLGRSRTEINYWIIGRLTDGVTLDQAQDDLNGILREIAREDRRMDPWSVTVDPLHSALFEYVRVPLWILAGAVVLAFLIACANVANLLLARGVNRARELAIRASLGAGRGRLVAQLLAEAMILGLGGGALGLLLTVWAVSLMPSFMPSVIPIPDSAATILVPEVSVSPVVLLFAAGVSMMAVAIFGVVPALQTTRHDLGVVLREAASNVSAGRRLGRAQHSIIVVEIALAAILLTTTGVAVRSTLRLLDVNAGLDPNGVMTLYVGELDRWEDDERARYYARVLEGVAAVPGVVSVGLNDYVPFQQEDDFEGFHREGRPRPDPSWRVEWRRVSADYFSTVRLPLRRGKLFTEAHNEHAPSVVVINEAMAQRYWPGEDPIGQRIVVHERVYGPSEVIGIVGDVRRRGLDQAAPAVMYVPYHRKPRPVVGFFARTEGDPTRLASAVRAAVWSVDPHQPIEDLAALDDILAQSTAIQRLVLRLVSLIAFVAVLLAAIGLYGVMSYWIGYRTKELSIRMALGARRGDVLRRLLWTGLTLALIGLPIGLLVAALLIRLVSSQMFGVDIEDPIPYLIASSAVVSVALVACWLPARRATRLDLIHVLRVE